MNSKEKHIYMESCHFQNSMVPTISRLGTRYHFLNALLICLCCFLPILNCHAGTVLLLNGELHSGKVTISDKGVMVNNDVFDLANVLVANFAERTDPPFLPSIGVILNNGSFITGLFRSFSEPTFKIGNATQPIAFPRSLIAAIVFNPVSRELIPKGKTGALLPDGDFFEGSFSGIKDNSALINSALFGIHRFQLKTQISAVILHDIQKANPRFEIGTKDGSRFLSNDIKIDRDSFTINDLDLGSIKLNNTDLVEIRAGGGRYQLLTDLKPVVSESGTASVPISNEGEGIVSISTGVNVAMTYEIPVGLNVFMCSVALPKDALPSTRVYFAVYCDGRSVFRSWLSDVTTAPQPIKVNCGTARKLSLRVESGAQGGGAVVGKWIEPIFIHP